MSKFTQGEWNYLEEYIPEGSILNEKKYLIQSETREDVALVWTEANARLIAAAPKMYELLKVWTQIRAEPTLKEARDTARKLLARIDGEEPRMSKFRDDMRNYLLHLEHELKKYAVAGIKISYEDEALDAYHFMDDLADDIRAFLEEAEE